MKKEYGGYMPLELVSGEEYFHKYEEAKIERFNCGRNAIAAVTLSIEGISLVIPYYNCNVVADTLKKYNIPFRYYYLDNHLEPQNIQLKENEWLLYVNYFGCASDDKIKKIAGKYKRVIFDNTQAFFARPILDNYCFNVYSARKFVGVCDGAYLIWSGKHVINADYPINIVWNRASYLLKSIELGTNAAYQDNLENESSLLGDIKKMSVLSKKMLGSIDYERIAKIRNTNYRILIDMFAKYNQLDISLDGYAPFVYPLYIENNDIRKKLINEKIYIPQWWKYLLDIVPENSIEAKLSKYLLPIPIDQRYCETEIKEMGNLIIALLESEKLYEY